VFHRKQPDHPQDTASRRARPGEAACGEIWAPELRFIRGKWYIYFAADAGTNMTHRIYVVENGSPAPTEGQWIFKGKVADRTDKWAIDATVFENRGRLYIAWSGWEGNTNGRQDIYLAEMDNP
jgi:GH43 family beta-xylosidase